MRTIYIIKIVSVILIFSMMFAVIPNISLATNIQASNTDWGGLISKVLKAVLEVIKNLFSSFSLGGVETDPKMEGKSFYQVAAYCKGIISSKGFTYDSNKNNNGGDWGKVNFSNGEDKGNPESSKRYSKEIDCSGYVSWVLFKYGCGDGDSKYATQFNTQKGTKKLKSIFSTQIGLFKKIGTLGECDSELQKGDILLMSTTVDGEYKGHVEIFSSKSGGTYYCYDAGSTSAIGNNSTTVGMCNDDTSYYTVYRVIK